VVVEVAQLAEAPKGQVVALAVAQVTEAIQLALEILHLHLQAKVLLEEALVPTVVVEAVVVLEQLALLLVVGLVVLVVLERLLLLLALLLPVLVVVEVADVQARRLIILALAVQEGVAMAAPVMGNTDLVQS
jgi:hypothetical protein